jgi:hypothetical protein
MGTTHFQMKKLKNVGTEMALQVLAYNMKRVISILGGGGLMDAIWARARPGVTMSSLPAQKFAFPHRLDPERTSSS